MIIETSKLEGSALDWAVAKAVSTEPGRVGNGTSSGNPHVTCAIGEVWYDDFSPSTDWAQGGPLIERRSIGFSYIGDQWLATADETSMGCGSTESGPTHLIAAMRAIVASELGDTVDVPEELLS